MIDLEKELLGQFTSEKISEDHCVVALTASAAWPYYEGHFPGHAVLPAVAIIDISQHVLQKCWKLHRAVRGVENFRIRNPVRPGDAIHIMIQQGLPNSFEVRWRSSAEEKIFAELTFT